jgi:hypothetical protein
MTPDEHAARAETLLDQATSDDHHADRLIARAHVHALLALRSHPTSGGSGPSFTPAFETRGGGPRLGGYEHSGIIDYGDGDPTHDRM